MKVTKLKSNSYAYLCSWGVIIVGIFTTRHLILDQNFTQKTYPIIYQWIYKNYTGLFDFLPFSLGDFIYALLILVLIKLIYKIIKLGLRRNFIKLFGLLNKIALMLAFFWLAFHWLWGFNYYKTSLIENPQQQMDVVILKTMANDHFTQVRQLSLQTLDFKNNNQVKPSLFSPLMRYFGVSGYFNPFTSEAQRIAGIPQVRIPFTNAHELAHQKSWAKEYEANYIGYKDALKGNKASQYSAEYTALNYLMSAIYPYDTVFVRQMLKAYSPRMKIDRQALIDYHNKYKGWADRFFSQLNHYFLKSNNQKEGIKSYNRFVELLYQDYIKKERIKN